ncbi:MAG: amino acid ABC transporter substrate-binding protein [Clostridiaceae bacterium]|nr:amino acid ABC transporter substrate-binding protein [Clostridiaceae bacterium]
MKKNSLILATILTMTMALVGCSSSSSSTSTSTNADTSTLLGQIKSAGKIRIGTEGTYSPFTYHDITGKLTGFDIEIAEAIAAKLGVKTEYVETKWDGIFAGLDAKRFDIIVNEVGISAERQAKYDFSDPYILSKPVLIVEKDNTSITKFEDLKGKKSAQSLTSNLGKIATSNGAELVAVDGFNQSIDLITSKRADATINDSLSFLDLKKQKPDIAVKVVAEGKEADKNGIMLNKGNKELLDAVNKALTDIKADGTYLKISQKWFGADVSK